MKPAPAPRSKSLTPVPAPAVKTRSAPPAGTKSAPVPRVRGARKKPMGAASEPSVQAGNPPAKATTTAPAEASEKAAKPPKVRLVRDSFTMPEADFSLVAVLKARALGLGRSAKKSELLRAGLQLLSQQEPAALLAALERLQPIKTGRPKKGD